MSNLSDFLKIKAIRWQYKDEDFEAQAGGHYIIDTQNNEVTMTIPVQVTTSFRVVIKDANVAGGFNNPNKFYVARKLGATYTIMGDTSPFDVDIPSQELSFVFDEVNNNVVV